MGAKKLAEDQGEEIVISKQEVMEFSREFGLSANVIEKDYVLGWVLDGLSHRPEINREWLFKGGTCLKKCFFETYRFSEDLDFTLQDESHINLEFLTGVFKIIADEIYERSGIEIPKDKVRFDIFENPRGKISAQGKISYRGPQQPSRGDLPVIKFDLTADEVVVLEPAIRDVHHPYSDKPESGIHVQCYSFEELFAEKIRALAERMRPRDLYDVVNLYRREDINPDRPLIMRTLSEKCAFKNIAIPAFGSLDSRPEKEELQNEWENMLAHQLPSLPPFHQFWQELPAVFEWLNREKEKAAVTAIPDIGQTADVSWRAPAMVQAWGTGVPLEIIRFAAANRLCVNLTYQNSIRLIEPYSLRRTKDGHILLYAVKHATGEARSYRIDRIQGVTISEESFVPKYAIEMGISGPLPVSSVSTRPRIMKTKASKPVSKRQRSSMFDYTVECPYCNKRFKRKTYSTKLNKHKDKYGYPCPGTTGYQV